MFWHSLKAKILLPAIVVLTVLAVIIIAVSSFRFLEFKNYLTFVIPIGFLGLVCVAAVLTVFATKITNPIKRLAELVVNAANGNIDADMDAAQVPKDEIGSLTLNVYTLIGVIRLMLSDLSRLTYNMNTNSGVRLQLDTSGYRGVYREIIGSINDLADSVSTMKKVMAVMDVQASMNMVVDLDYNLIYINRSLADTFQAGIECYKGEKCYKALRNVDSPCSFCLLPGLLAEKDSYPSRNFEFLYDDIRGMWIGGQASIMRWIDGSMVYFQSFNDETQKKRDQTALQEAVQTAETASLAKSTFLANMSHDSGRR